MTKTKHFPNDGSRWIALWSLRKWNAAECLPSSKSVSEKAGRIRLITTFRSFDLIWWFSWRRWELTAINIQKVLLPNQFSYLSLKLMCLINYLLILLFNFFIFKLIITIWLILLILMMVVVISRSIKIGSKSKMVTN